MFDDIILKNLTFGKYTEAYKRSQIASGYRANHELNSANLIKDFLKDMDLENDFLEYCKMRYEMVLNDKSFDYKTIKKE